MPNDIEQVASDYPANWSQFLDRFASEGSCAASQSRGDIENFARHGPHAPLWMSLLTQALVAGEIIDKGIPTAGLLAHVQVAKHSNNLPLYRQE